MSASDSAPDDAIGPAVVFIAHEPGQVRDLRPVAHLIKSRYRPIFVLPVAYRGVERDLAALHADGFATYLGWDRQGRAPKPPWKQAQGAWQQTLSASYWPGTPASLTFHARADSLQQCQISVASPAGDRLMDETVTLTPVWLRYRLPVRPTSAAVDAPIRLRLTTDPSTSVEVAGVTLLSFPRRPWHRWPAFERLRLRLQQWWPVGTWREYGGLRRRQRQISALLAELSPRLLVLSEENPATDSGDFICAARHRGIPTVVLPFTIPNPLEPLHVAARTSVTACERAVIRLLAPEWLSTVNGRTVARLPTPQVLVRRLSSTAPPLPWVYNSGMADVVAIESRHAGRRMISLGVSKHKLVDIGSLNHDFLAAAAARREEARQHLRRTFGWSGQKGLLLAALPRDVFDRAPNPCVTDFVQFAAFLARHLMAVEGLDILVCPHPATTPEQITALRDHGLTVADIETVHLIPLCDLFVASISATIRWAVASGTPVINFDCFGFDYQDFVDAPGVVTVSTMAEFASTLHRVTSDAAALTRLRDAQGCVAPDWGTLDGDAGRRLIDLVDRLAGTPDQETAMSVGMPSG